MGVKFKGIYYIQLLEKIDNNTERNDEKTDATNASNESDGDMELVIKTLGQKSCSAEF